MGAVPDPTGGPWGPVDLSSCDREPVHAPNATQPFGAVIVAERADLRIRRASANLSQWAGVEAAAAIGADLAAVLGADRADEVARLASGGQIEGNSLLVFTARSPNSPGPVDVTAHTNGDDLIVELEPGDEERAGDDYATLKHSIGRLQGSLGLRPFCDRVAEEVRRLTGYDRVMVYRFHPDHSGEVVAEVMQPGLPSYLGLNYPAADIPVPAREIYRKVWVRTLPDIQQPGVPLLPADRDLPPVDLTYCHLRGVSPIHAEYLTNMGVTATMSLSLLRGEALWGLVACHHDSPRRPSARIRAACEVIAQVASHQLNAAEDRDDQRFREAARAAHDAMIARAAGGEETLATLVDGTPGLLDLIPAGGAALRVDGRWIMRGEVPGEGALEAFSRWLAETHSRDDVFATDTVSADYSPAADWGGVAVGVLAARLTLDSRDVMLWLRPELPRTVQWAGDPSDKPVVSGPHGPRLHPRKSFEVWLESVRGRAAPWAEREIDEVRRLRLAVREVIVGQRERIARLTALLQAVVDGTTDAVFVKDRDGKYLLFNQAAARFVGKPIDDVLGRDDRTLYNAKDARVVMERDRRVMATGLAETEEEELASAGTVRTYLATKAPYRDATGAVIGLIGVSRDMTEQKRVEKQLRYQELMLREAAELANVGGWEFDPVTLDGKATDEVIRILGSPPTPVGPFEAIGLFDVADQPVLEVAMRAAIRDGTPYDLELQLATPSGERKWVRSICRPIVEDGKVVWVRGSLQDISDRKRAEEEIRLLNTDLEQRVRDRTAELEESIRELEAFSYSVSHDLRAPLRAIDGFTRIVLDEHGPDLPADARGYLVDVRSNASRMGRLVDHLLEFSRLGRKRLNRQPVETGRMVADCFREVLSLAEGRRIETTVGDLPWCQADAPMLRQVWLNLLSNAVKYSVKRDPAVIEVGAAVGPGGTTYIVRDNGTGFDMRYAHRLFGVFQRLHRAEEYEGTGIGLALVQRIVHRHGGRVWAEAEPGQGATFFFTLEEGP